MALDAQTQGINPEYPEDEHTIGVIGKELADSTLIRWAPSSIDLWLLGNKYGYKIERKLAFKDGQIVFDTEEYQELPGSPILPMPLEKAESLAYQDNYVAIVMQAIYGDSFEVEAEENSSLINKAKELENRFSFALLSCDLSANAAKAHGLFYIDKELKLNERYVYRIRINCPDSLMSYEPGLLWLEPSATDELPKPYDIDAQAENKMVKLQWPSGLLNEVYTAYQIERSDDGGKTYHKRNENPTIALSNSDNDREGYTVFVDSIPEMGKEFFYRVVGITPFGELGIPSEPVAVTGGPKPFNLNPIITKVEESELGAVTLIWELFPDDLDRLSEFVISRSSTEAGPYQVLDIPTLDAAKRSAQDINPLSINYYKVTAYDDLGRSYESFPALLVREDSIPPSVPQGLVAVSDSMGIVTLSWNENTEKDLQGYWVYRYINDSNSRMKISKELSSSASFVDTMNLNTLTKDYYYQVSALDYHYNESEASQAYHLVIHDTVSPARLSFTSFSTEGGQINLQWNNPFNDDVKHCALYRRAGNAEDWILVAKRGVDSCFFSDNQIEGGKKYTYLVVAVDYSGNESLPSPIVTLSSSQSGNLGAIQLKGKFLTNGPSVQLNWQAGDDPLAIINIFRNQAGEQPTLYKKITGNNLGFIDTGVQAGISYTYRIQAIFEDGKRSELSEPLTINTF